jgi:fatty-acyl-CoA synthase
VTVEALANTRGPVNISVASAVETNALLDPDHVAIRSGGVDLTYIQVQERSARLASALARAGVSRGDRVAFVGLNSPTFLITMLAAFRLGAVFVPVNFRLAGPELARVFERSGATSLVCEEGHRESVEGVRDATQLTTCVLVDDDAAAPLRSADAPAGWVLLSTFCADLPSVPSACCGFDDPAILMFTSGTTGTPKGVILTHGNIWWNSANVDLRLDTRRRDVTYAAAPLFHIGALNSFVIRTLARSGTVVLARSFEPSAMLRDLVDSQVNTTFAVPAMLAALARVPGVFDAQLSALRAVVVAGAPVAPTLVQLYAQHGIFLQQAWGLTETAPFATHLPIEHTLTKLGSAGMPMPYTEVRVVDLANSQPVDAFISGEIVVRGPNVTQGYWENPEATRSAFDDAGWFHSGDIGYFDDDGYLFIVDRLKDMIITGGENVYPAEVERALADLPGLADVAVVGVADVEWGEVVVAVAVVDSASSLSLEEVRTHASERIARYKLPRRLMTLEEMPRNASGKLDKLRIRAIAAEHHSVGG